MPDPSYEEVAGGATGHAQVVRIDYDPEAIAYEALLEVFWRIHDPTQHNRQGSDVGPQYRSVIFCFDDDQRRMATASRDARARAGLHGSAPIRTEIAPAGPFYRAEEHHRRYYEKRGQMARSLLGARGGE